MKIINDKAYIKILFFGTALAGKTTSLQWFFDNLIPDGMKMTNQLRSVKTSFGQTLLFDFVPIQINRNIIVRFYTATGQDYYSVTRRMLFEDVDGIFFIIDSQKNELMHNKEFILEFDRYLKDVDGVKDAVLIVLYNKQDLEEIYSSYFLEQELNLRNYPSYSTCALSGMNLRKALMDMLNRIFRKFYLRVSQ